jgi:hypothetical protein
MLEAGSSCFLCLLHHVARIVWRASHFRQQALVLSRSSAVWLSNGRSGARRSKMIPEAREFASESSRTYRPWCATGV